MVFIHVKTLISNFVLFVILSGLLLAVGTDPVEAGNWRVSPIRLSFDARTRSEVVTISNDDEQTLTLEVAAMQWSQDADGQDIYLPATDLIFFPKHLVIEPKNERVIRTGIKVPAINKEKSYRLFIKEVPERNQNAPNTVAIAIQFGVPVFVKPIKEEIAGAIEDAQLVAGKFSSRIENNGNGHFRVRKITVTGYADDGERLLAQELNGWYLLNNRSRTLSIGLSDGTCQQINALEIQVQTDRIEMNERIDVDPTMCLAP